MFLLIVRKLLLKLFSLSTCIIISNYAKVMFGRFLFSLVNLKILLVGGYEKLINHFTVYAVANTGINYFT